MCKILKCDRCGRIYREDSYDHGDIALTHYGLLGCEYTGCSYHLCPDCVTSYNEWFCKESIIKMRCPKCGSPYSQTTIDDMRNENLNDKIFRTRKCYDCGYSFNTVETFCNEDIDGSIFTQIEKDRELAACKHKAMKTAKELYYGQIVIDKIQEAKTVEQVGRILKNARTK